MKNRAGHHTHARIARDAARAAFDARLAQVKQDLAARGIGGRVADRIGKEAVDLIDYTADVLRDSKGVIAGTLAALMLWIFRNPIIAWCENLFSDDAGD